MTKLAQAIRIAHARGYRVTAGGAVRSPIGRIRKLTLTTLGRTLYWRFTAKIDGKSVAIPVHRFAGFQRFGEQALAPRVLIRHRNGVSLDNRPRNFALGDHSSNLRDLGHAHLSQRGQRGNRIRNARRRAGGRNGRIQSLRLPLSYAT